MSITLRTPEEISQMRRAGAIVAECHRQIAAMIAPGITTMDIERHVEAYIRSQDAIPYTIGYKGYKYATCASVNDVIAHGFPSDAPLAEGDLCTIDIVVQADGWIGDSAWTYAVGQLPDEARRLMEVTRECLDIGIREAQPGKKIGDVMHAVQKHAEENGFSVVRDLLGHGVGRELHEEPNFAHVGKPGKGFRLKEGMVLTIEPMINEGTWQMFIDSDGWTCRTMDGKRSAQYEHTLVIQEGGPLILTQQ
ncbi:MULTISPECIES: type I methionyl aminopeptidase [unclassified Paenibacillus]|uniref:type I methionyl aminopeptidase n=1 Tax=unclassified Paenibacillus TaxID=185978 RepID=UPI0009557C8A|nr:MULTISPECIES: type I methionyl aminopeptidase [unclassified Paenibacillus]ASS68874.1 type I methionyl aminopeptidase [Paenibacillus sp. RUD330]SIR16842.1 methionyl aminopeptidase [Paenibacillus sp. RU4X]SIR21574.1 methionyl aminopeptidase [Paenibacillus sp. RU4T]